MRNFFFYVQGMSCYHKSQLGFTIIMPYAIFFYNSTLSDKEDVKKMAVDAMFKLEHGVEDKQKSKEALPTLEQLKVYNIYLAFFW